MNLKLKIRGMAPLLMQSGVLANPLHPMTKELKKITGLRKKTDDDLEQMLKLKYLASMYYDEKTGPYIPGENLDRAYFDAAKELKLGKRFTQCAMIVEDKLPLVYEGPRKPQALYDDLNFVDVRMVKIGTSRVAMSRPIFKVWALNATLAFNEELIDLRDMHQINSFVGRQGLGTFRRRFGKFAVDQV